MFDAKKLLDALGTPATPAAPAAPPAAPAPAAASPAPANPLGAGTLLSDLIGLANQPSPPPASETAQGEQGHEQAPPPKPKAPPPPADLSDLLLNKAQEYLKTPQGNAVANAVVLGLTKAVTNSDTGRKLAETAKAKGSALFNRFLNKGTSAAGSETIPPALPQPPLAALPEPTGVDSGETSLLIIRAMIAAAAADGRIDDDERARILSVLKQSGIDGEGVKLIEAELDHPATAAELAAAVKTPEMAVQVYSAVRRVITPNTVEERVFLAHLSGALRLDQRLVAQIDAMAAGALKA